jgi:DNA-binding response OmpR family regulator
MARQGIRPMIAKVRFPEKCCECGQLIEYDNDKPIVMGSLVLRPGFQTAEWQGKSVYFTASEFATLVFIAKRSDTLARKMSIYTKVFEQEDGTPDPKIVDVIVCKIRSKLTSIGGAGLIGTIWGQGYRIDLTNQSLPKANRPRCKLQGE